MIHIAIDEFPTSKNMIESRDYAGKFIYSQLGFPCINLNNKGDSVFRYRVEGKSLYLKIQDKFNNCTYYYKEWKNRLDAIRDAWRGVYRIFLLGIVPELDGNLFTYNGHEICISHYDTSRVYFSICLFSSHYFNLGWKEENVVWNEFRKSCIIKNVQTVYSFHRIKGGAGNVLNYLFKRIDITANTAFPYYFVPFFLHSSHFVSGNSGIECMLIASNPQSHFFRADSLRKKIFSLLGGQTIPPKLKYNIRKSSMYVSYEVEENDLISFMECKEITIGYDPYYPNGILVKRVKKILNKYGIKVSIKKMDYFHPMNNTDFSLYLFSNEFCDNIMKYYFIALISNLKSNKTDLHEYLNTVFSYCKGTISKEDTIQVLKKIVKKYAIYYSIGEIQSTYLCRNTEQKFIYIDER